MGSSGVLVRCCRYIPAAGAPQAPTLSGLPAMARAGASRRRPVGPRPAPFQSYNQRYISIGAPMQTKIPCVIMRGGTSRGPFFKLSDLPADAPTRDAVLLAVMGSPHEIQVDG